MTTQQPTPPTIMQRLQGPALERPVEQFTDVDDINQELARLKRDSDAIAKASKDAKGKHPEQNRKDTQKPLVANNVRYQALKARKKELLELLNPPDPTAKMSPGAAQGKLIDHSKKEHKMKTKEWNLWWPEFEPVKKLLKTPEEVLEQGKEHMDKWIKKHRAPQEPEK